MGIDHLFGDTPPTGSPPVPRLTPRSPVSIKELTGILVFFGLAYGAYTQMSKFAEKTAVEQVVQTQWQQRLETQHNFDLLNGKVDKLIETQAAQAAAAAASEARRGKH